MSPLYCYQVFDKSGQFLDHVAISDFLNLKQPKTLLIFRSVSESESLSFTCCHPPAALPFFSLSFYVIRHYVKGTHCPSLFPIHLLSLIFLLHQWFSTSATFENHLGSFEKAVSRSHPKTIRLESLGMGPGDLYVLKLSEGYSIQLGLRTIVLEK